MHVHKGWILTIKLIPSVCCIWLFLNPGNNLLAYELSSAWQGLGRSLFEDKRLSLDDSTACASCHLESHALADQRPQSIGHRGTLITRNAPSLLGLRQHQPLFWDGRRDNLSLAVLDPFFSEHEHALTGPDDLVDRVSSKAQYRAAFAELIGAQSQITTVSIATAITAHLQSLPAGTSRFDQWRESPRSVTLEPGAMLGYELFTGRAGCSQCHLIDAVSAPLTDDRFHAHGVGAHHLQTDNQALLQRVALMDDKTLKAALLSDPQVAALGRFLVTGVPADIGAFRTPSLRNVMRTAPYMHDGSIDSIAAVIERELYYSATDKGASFSLSERQAIVEFLSLLDDIPVAGDVLNTKHNP